MLEARWCVFFHRYGQFIVYPVLASAVLGPLLLPGYLLTLDMIFPVKLPDSLFGFEAPARGGFLIVYLPLYYLGKIVPFWILQKLTLFLVLSVAGIGAHYLVPTRSPLPRYFAGLLFMVNPFVQARLLAGHWVLLIGYAFLPFAIESFIVALKRPGARRALVAALAFSIVSVSIHMAALAFLAFAVLTLTRYVERRSFEPVKAMAVTLAWYVPLNAYWLLPTALNSSLPAVGEEQIRVFAAKSSQFNALFNILAMYGFWRKGGWIYPPDISPLFYLPFLVILYLAVFGTLQRWRQFEVKSVVIVWGTALALGAGIAGPFSGPLQFLLSLFPVAQGFRDSQKFVALLVLAYAYGGALGLAESTRMWGQSRPARYFLRCAVAVPLLYSFTLFGTWGQLHPVDYPDEWYRAKQIIAADPQDGNLLFLPWYLYADVRWLPNRDKRLGWLASDFFDQPVLRSLRLDIAAKEGAGSPAHTYLESILVDREGVRDFGHKIAVVNVKYVLLAKEADFEKYTFLYRQPDLQVLVDSDTLALFGNRVPVSRAYVPEDVMETSETVHVERISLVSYRLGEGHNQLAFVSPNWRAEGWVLNGNPGVLRPGYPTILFSDSKEGTIVFRPFFTHYLPSYAISLVTVVCTSVVIALRRPGKLRVSSER